MCADDPDAGYKRRPGQPVGLVVADVADDEREVPAGDDAHEETHGLVPFLRASASRSLAWASLTVRRSWASSASVGGRGGASQRASPGRPGRVAVKFPC